MNYQELLILLEIKHNLKTFEYVAFLGDEELGSCRGEYGRPVDPVWLEKLYADLAFRSDTVMLMTACGCSRLQDGISPKEDSFDVPIYRRKSSIRLPDVPIFSVEDVALYRRTFRTKGETAVEGFRIYREEF